LNSSTMAATDAPSVSSSSVLSSQSPFGEDKLPLHPLDQLIEKEITRCANLIRSHFAKLTKNLRFYRIDLLEPEKSVILQYENGQKTNFSRSAFAVVVDRVQEKTYEVVVSLSPRGSERVVSVVYVPGVQPGFLSDEYEMCEHAVKIDPKVIEALKRRGINDISSVMVDAWVSYFHPPNQRLCNPLFFLRTNDSANGYDRPIEGLNVFVDLHKMIVVEVRDNFTVPIPPPDPLSQWQGLKKFRKDLKPFYTNQPEGVSFRVEGKRVYWQNWSFHVGFTQWEGLVLHQIAYNDKGRIRPVIYRASIAEMVVPYGDPRDPNHRKNAFDAGEDGLGRNCQSLELGCDCIGSVYYFDATLVNVQGIPYRIKNAICLHEEDAGMLWRHQDWRTGISEVRRSRRLVISFFSTIANYDYGFFWYFYQDGTIHMESKLTGILSTSAIATGDHPGGYGTMIAKNLYAPIHQHFFVARLDMQVDGLNNAIQEVNVRIPEEHEPNPYRSAFYAHVTTFQTELEAARLAEPRSARVWRIVNPSSRNRCGELCGWRLMPRIGNCTPTFACDDSKLMQRAGWLKKTIWVTPFDSREKYPGGSYVYQKELDDGLTKWTQANRNIYNKDIVVWYIFGVTHVVRAEDWPVMPAEFSGFDLKPDNFFDCSPAMDVPPTNQAHACCDVNKPTTSSKLSPISRL